MDRIRRLRQQRWLAPGEQVVEPLWYRHWVVLERFLSAALLLVGLVLVGDWVAGLAVAAAVSVGPPVAGSNLAALEQGAQVFRLTLTSVGFAFAGLLVLGAWIRWKVDWLTVTNRRVILETGLLDRQVTEIMLDHIQDVVTHQSALGQLLGYGRIEIDAAGREGMEIFEFVQRPEELREQVIALQELRGSGGTL